LKQPGQIVCKPLSKKFHQKKRVGGMAQGIGPEFKSQYHKTNKQTKTHDRKEKVMNNFFPNGSACFPPYIPVNFFPT
jgi:hypothetical protein